MRYRFEGFEFDPRTGLLDRPSDTSKEPEYLAPQPSQLLELLLEKAPDLVTKDDISRRLWPDVEVEVEQSLHHSVRQVRRALGDSAAEERFIRTIHRRGYAFAAPVETIPDTSPDDSDTDPRQPGFEAPVSGSRNIPVFALAAILAALAIALSYVLAQGRPEPLGGDRIRVAVMSFRPPLPTDRVPTIAERLVSRLTGTGDSRYDVIGPSTTERFETRTDPLTGVADELDVEYVLNGRFVPDSTGFVLAEVIRTSDGAHVWAEFLDMSESDSILAYRIERAFRAETGDGNPP